MKGLARGFCFSFATFFISMMTTEFIKGTSQWSDWIFFAMLASIMILAWYGWEKD
jgi:hypothetical protein